MEKTLQELEQLTFLKTGDNATDQSYPTITNNIKNEIRNQISRDKEFHSNDKINYIIRFFQLCSRELIEENLDSLMGLCANSPDKMEILEHRDQLIEFIYERFENLGIDFNVENDMINTEHINSVYEEMILNKDYFFTNFVRYLLSEDENSSKYLGQYIESLSNDEVMELVNKKTNKLNLSYETITDILSYIFNEDVDNYNELLINFFSSDDKYDILDEIFNSGDMIFLDEEVFVLYIKFLSKHERTLDILRNNSIFINNIKFYIKKKINLN